MTAFKATRGLALAAGIAMSLLLMTASGALAASPVRSDPFAQQATLTASDEIGKSLLGSAVALSSDGNMALIGGPDDNEGSGAVWVFTRKGSTWTERAKLTGAGEIGSGKFGTGVALSSDGKTALIGGPADNNGLGAAWVFTRRGSTWRQRGSKLTGNGANVGSGEETYCQPGDEVCFVGQVRFGESVALSSDGKTALIGGPGDNANDGAAWLFTRSGSKWTQQGEKLVGGGEQNINGRYPFTEHIGGQFGASVALSADGSTALIGGPRDASDIYESPSLWSAGAAWVFVRSGSTWTQQGEKFSRGSGGISGIRFGQSVALSSNGNSALIGAPNDENANGEDGAGSVWAFTRSGSTLTQAGEGLQNRECSEHYEHFGLHVALSAEGDAALIAHKKATDLLVGCPSALPAGAWAFIGPATTWTKQTPPLECGGEQCGAAASLPAVDLSGNGNTALVGTAVFRR